MEHVWTLLQMRWRVFRNSALRKWQGLEALVFVPAFLVAIAVFFLARGMATAMARFLDPGLVEALLALLFLALYLLFFGSSFATALSSFYLASDLELLLAAPVPRRAVFTAKFIQNLVPSYLLDLVLILPAMLGIGQALGYGPVYYVLCPLVLFLVPLIPQGVGIFITMLVARFLPAWRLKEVLAVLSSIIALGFYLMSQLANPSYGLVSSSQMLRMAESSTRYVRWPVFPSTWAAYALIGAGRGAWLLMLAHLLPFLAASLLVYGLCLLGAETLYYTGWAKMGIAARRASRREEPVRKKGLLRLQGPSWAIAFKDVMCLRRDLQTLVQLLWPLVYAIVWGVWMLRGKTMTTLLTGGLWVVYAAMALVIGWMVSTPLTVMAVNREGKGFWVIQVAPVDTGELLWAKFILSYLFYLPLTGLAFLLPSLKAGLGWKTMAQGLGLLAIAGVGIIALELAIGARFPKLDWEHPKQMHSWEADLLSMIACLAYAVMLALCLVLMGVFRFFRPAWPGFVLPLIALAIAVVILAPPWLLLERAKGSLERKLDMPHGEKGMMLGKGSRPLLALVVFVATWLLFWSLGV